jgi:hypothetical protein
MYQQKTNKQVFTWLNLTQEMLNPPRKEEGYYAYV